MERRVTQKRAGALAHVVGMLVLVNALAAAMLSSMAAADPKPVHIVAFGDSLSAGYGLRP